VALKIGGKSKPPKAKEARGFIQDFPFSSVPANCSN
jgi:hypothetical protein